MCDTFPDTMHINFNVTIQYGNGNLASEGDDVEASINNVLTLVAIYFCGGLSQVLQTSYGISIERDWIVSIAENNRKWLEATNVILNQIHLLCIIVSPSIAVLMHSRGGVGVVLSVGLIKIISLLLMNVLTSRTYRLIPSLHVKVGQESSTSSSAVLEEDDVDQDTEIIDGGLPSSSSSPSWGYADDIRVFLSQKVVWAGIALAVLYCNVLTFGGMLVAYLKSCGMSWGVIGFAQGISNFSGLLGTCIFAISQKYVDIKITALRAIWWQFLCLSVSILGVLMNGSNRLVSAWLIIAGVILLPPSYFNALYLRN